MPKSGQWILLITLLAALAGCQRYSVGDIHEEISAAKPKQTHLRQGGPTGCTYFPSCDEKTLFPGTTFHFAPADAECVLPAAISMGPALYPKGVVIQNDQTVWVGLAVSSEGLVTRAKVIGSTDSRFDQAAYRTAIVSRFRPMTCGITAYDSYVQAPFVFKPAPQPIPDAQAIYDRNELYPNDRQLP